MLRKKLSKFGMATAGVAVGAIMAISPVMAQGTAPSSPSNGSTLLASILAAAEAAGIALSAEQTKALAEVVAEITEPSVSEHGTANDIDEDVEEVEEVEEDDTAPAAAATTTKLTVTSAAQKSNEESKGDD